MDGVKTVAVRVKLPRFDGSMSWTMFHSQFKTDWAQKLDTLVESHTPTCHHAGAGY
jgi:hypothetical protein